jgi:membrane protease YdiL (CAAX protease family)
MPTPSTFDFITVALLVVVAPLYAKRTYARFLETMRTGSVESRIGEYRGIVWRQWALGLGLVLYWLAMDRPLSALGIALPGGARFALGLGATALGLVLLVLQWRAIVAATGASLESLNKQMEPISSLLPATARELSAFRVVAVTAGICEEVLYRGFFFWFVSVSTGPWLAVLATAVVFGLGHAYQGIAGVVKTGFIGFLGGLSMSSRARSSGRLSCTPLSTSRAVRSDFACFLRFAPTRRASA